MATERFSGSTLGGCWSVWEMEANGGRWVEKGGGGMSGWRWMEQGRRERGGGQLGQPQQFCSVSLARRQKCSGGRMRWWIWKEKAAELCFLHTSVCHTFNSHYSLCLSWPGDKHTFIQDCVSKCIFHHVEFYDQDKPNLFSLILDSGRLLSPLLPCVSPSVCRDRKMLQMVLQGGKQRRSKTSHIWTERTEQACELMC